MRLFKWLIIVAVVAALFLSLSPLLLKAGIARWFESKGYQFELKKLSINYFVGSVKFQGLQLIGPQGETLDFYEARFVINAAQLFEKQLRIDSLEISNLKADIDSQSDALLIAGLPVTAFIPGSTENPWPLSLRTGQFSNFELCKTKARQCMAMDSIALTRMEMLSNTDGLAVEFHGPLTIGKTFLKDQNDELSVFYFESLTWQRAYFSEQRRNLSNLLLRNIQLVESVGDASEHKSPTQIQLGELRLSSLNIVSGNSPRLSLGILNAQSPRQVLSKTKSGHYVWPQTLKAWVPQDIKIENGDVTIDGKSAELSWQEINIQGATLKWSDLSVNPVSSETFNQLNIKIGSSVANTTEKTIEIKVSANFAEEGSLRIEGKVPQLGQPRSFNGSGLITGLDTEHFPEHARRMINQGVNAGIIDVAWQAREEGNKWILDSQWRFSEFEFQKTRNNSRYMPLELAFDLLRDRNNAVDTSIHLETNIGGDSFSLAKLFDVHLRKEIHQQAQQKVNPSNAVSIPARDKPSFQKAYRPLLYPAKQLLPAELDMIRLDEIANDLKRHSDLTLAFCPVTTGGEWAEMFNNGERPSAGTQLSAEHRQEMTDLAVARGQSVRALLLERGVHSSQIVICPAAIDMTKFGPSYSSIRL